MPRVVTGFSCQKEFLAKIDARAQSLGMTRSQYIVQVLRMDLLTGNPHLSIMGEKKTTDTPSPSSKSGKTGKG